MFEAEVVHHAAMGEDSRFDGRLIVDRVFWRLVCVVEKGSLTGVLRKM